MSDVEQIVNANFERVKWAAEYTDSGKPEPEPEAPVRRPKPRRSERTFRAIHTAVLACAMFAGAGATLVGIGLASGDALTIGIGLLVTCLFISTGARLDGLSRTV